MSEFFRVDQCFSNRRYRLEPALVGSDAMDAFGNQVDFTPFCPVPNVSDAPDGHILHTFDASGVSAPSETVMDVDQTTPPPICTIGWWR